MIAITRYPEVQGNILGPVQHQRQELDQELSQQKLNQQELNQQDLAFG